MNAISQHITKSAAAKGIESALGVKTQMRGLAGNHTLNRGRLLQRKCACGGQCESCKKPEEGMLHRAVQTKLAVSSPGDRYEQEADRVAEHVLSAPSHGAIQASVPRIQRFAGHSAGQAEAAPKSVDRVLSNQGQPLNPALREDMQQRFGVDFSRVRVHSGAAAETSAREVNAHAYTVGHDIVFGPGRFAPSTQQGQRLIAHELTHVVQQSGAAGGAMSRQVQRKVVDDDEHVTCRSTRTNSVADLMAAETKAANLADLAAAELRKRPPTQNTQDLTWRRFHLNFNEPRDRCRFIPEIADRFEGIAKAIRSTGTMYWCTSASEPMDLCKGHFARTYPGEKIALCSWFWSDTDEQATTLLHEWTHYVYDSQVNDEAGGGFDMAECYANFANEIFGDPVTIFAGIPECTPHKDAPKLDHKRLDLPCSKLFVNISAIGTSAFNLPGSTRYFAGAGLEALYPLDRMHELEIAVGAKYLRSAPSDAKDRVPYLWGIHGGINVRRHPWRYGLQAGGYLEAGQINVSDETGNESHTYGSVGVKGGFNFRLGKETAIQVLGDLQIGKALATENQRGFNFFQLGVNVVLELE